MDNEKVIEKIFEGNIKNRAKMLKEGKIVLNEEFTEETLVLMPFWELPPPLPSKVHLFILTTLLLIVIRFELLELCLIKQPSKYVLDVKVILIIPVPTLLSAISKQYK